MSGRFLIGLDLGGSGVRCLVVDVSSGRTHVALRTLAFRSQPGDPMTSELAPDEVWTGLAAAAREALERAGAGPDAVLGIAATSMRHASVLLDGDGEVLLATTNRDARGAARAIELADLHGAEIHRRTGHWPNPVQPAPRLCAFAASRPEAFARAAHHLSLSDWVAYRLCGEIATEASQASETLLCQIAERAWASDWIDRLDLPRHLFPEIRPAGTALGGDRKSVV